VALQALIFDMDGVLFDTERLAADSWMEAGRSLGFDLTEDIVRGTVGLDHVLTRAYYDKLFEGRFPFERVQVRNRELFRSKITEGGVPMKPGVERILSEARRLGLQVALGTSSRALYAHSMLWLSGIEHYFHALVTRDLVQAGKPSPEIYLKAASLLGREPAECLVFEDSPIGIEAALAAGMPVVMVPDLIAPSEAVAAKCAKVFPSLEEAARALEGMVKARA